MWVLNFFNAGGTPWNFRNEILGSFWSSSLLAGFLLDRHPLSTHRDLGQVKSFIVAWRRILPSGYSGSDLCRRALGWRRIALSFLHLCCYTSFWVDVADPDFSDGGISLRYCFGNCLQVWNVLYWAQHCDAWILILELLCAAKGSGTLSFINSLIASLYLSLHISQILALHALERAAGLHGLFRLLSSHNGWHTLLTESWEPLLRLHCSLKLLQKLCSQCFDLFSCLHIS